MSTPLEEALGEVEPTEAEAPEEEAQTEEVEAQPEPEESEPVSEEPDERPRDEKGKFAKKEKAEEPDPKAWQYAAYQDEKDKRQRYEAELAQLRAQVQTQQQQPQKPVDPIDDPEGFRQSLRQEVDQRLTNERLVMSERFARSQHGDEAWDAANEWLMGQSPADRQRYIQSPDPWGEAIKAHKRHQAMQEIGDDPAAYRERLEAEIRERVMSEVQQTPAQPSQPKPSNFASARSAGKRTGPAWAGPTPLSSILPE